MRHCSNRLLSAKGLIRVGIGMPDDVDFELIATDDPYGYASAKELSLFRRPSPTTNLQFLSTIMWDGRETFAGNHHCNLVAEGGKRFESMHFDLSDQANTATLGRAQGNALTDPQRESIVGFETALPTAQTWDEHARGLRARGGRGGRITYSQSLPITASTTTSATIKPKHFSIIPCLRFTVLGITQETRRLRLSRVANVCSMKDR
jgi:cytochrome c peroxidase